LQKCVSTPMFILNPAYDVWQVSKLISITMVH
jgi:hypothetical protein